MKGKKSAAGGQIVAANPNYVTIYNKGYRAGQKRVGGEYNRAYALGYRAGQKKVLVGIAESGGTGS
jgi:hypothetical protein